MPIKSVKMKISKNKKMYFFLMSERSFTAKIRSPGPKMCPVAWLHTDRHTHTHTKVTTVGTLSGLQEFFLQPIIKDRPKKYRSYFYLKRLQKKKMSIFFIRATLLKRRIFQKQKLHF